jgi:hypothetical protein
MYPTVLKPNTEDHGCPAVHPVLPSGYCLSKSCALMHVVDFFKGKTLASYETGKFSAPHIRTSGATWTTLAFRGPATPYDFKTSDRRPNMASSSKRAL